jgi:hypothetical protein
MTRQEVFDIVATHLIKQGKESRIGGGCAYRGEGGLKCALGVLIKDEFYREIWNGDGLGPDVFEALESSGVVPMELTGDDDTRSDGEFLEGLQSIHDDIPSHCWFESLLAFADMTGLDETAAVRAQRQLEQAIR